MNEVRKDNFIDKNSLKCIIVFSIKDDLQLFNYKIYKQEIKKGFSF